MKYPAQSGFSVQNLWYAKKFFLTYMDNSILQTLSGELSWSNNVLILDKTKSVEEKDGFKKLYGWTSDACGIRHGEYPDSFLCGESEARYMLIICSAFINYLITKLEEKNDQPV